MLDTNIVSAILKGVPAADARLAALEPEDWCISALVRSELRYGAALVPSSKGARLVDNFLELARTVAWDAAAADTHGPLRAALRAVGKPIGHFDEMIAAHALSLGAILVTDNTQHFANVPNLRLENWLR